MGSEVEAAWYCVPSSSLSRSTPSFTGTLQFNTTGSGNTASGLQALQNNDAGNNNTAIGTNALLQSTGNKNIAIGFGAGSNLVSGHTNIYLGSEGVDRT
jgi:hypothetical protein